MASLCPVCLCPCVFRRAREACQPHVARPHVIQTIKRCWWGLRENGAVGPCPWELPIHPSIQPPPLPFGLFPVAAFVLLAAVFGQFLGGCIFITFGRFWPYSGGCIFILLGGFGRIRAAAFPRRGGCPPHQAEACLQRARITINIPAVGRYIAAL